jgi:hypothetical protein
MRPNCPITNLDPTICGCDGHLLEAGLTFVDVADGTETEEAQ